MTARGFTAFPKTKRRGATTWWGKAWIKALEDTSLDPAPLKLGRRYAHAGVVGPITVSPGRIAAVVHDEDTVYSTAVFVDEMTDLEWSRFLDRVAEQTGHIAALLDNDMPHDLVTSAHDAGVPLLPGIGDLEPSCDCPGWELPCRHAAALAFQVSWLLDADPFVLLLLRGRGEKDLLDSLRDRVAGPVGTRTPVVDVPSGEDIAAGELPSRPTLPSTTTPVVLPVDPPPGIDPETLRHAAERAVRRARTMLRASELGGEVRWPPEEGHAYWGGETFG